MSEAYSVVVSGQLVEGFELGQVKENLIQAFKLSAAQADKLLCGKPVALKRGIEKNVAVKLSQRLQDLGAVSIIKAAPAAKKAPVSGAPKAPALQAASSEPAAPAVAVEQPSREQPASVDSGAGKQGIDELWDQTKSIYNPTDDKPADKFTKQIAFNVIPHIDSFMDSGETKEEWKMVAETKKIVDTSIKVTATCVRVPVFVGHSEAVNIEFEDFLDEDEAREILRTAPGVLVVDKREDGGYITPVECVGDFATFVSRIRQDSTIENGLNLWCVSDNLRKGAALNAVQIAEVLGREVLKKG